MKKLLIVFSFISFIMISCDRESELKITNTETQIRTQLRSRSTDGSFLKTQDDYEYQSDFGKIGEMFSLRMTELHDGQQAKITHIIMQHSEYNEFIHFEYYVGEDENELYSVGYLSDLAT